MSPEPSPTRIGRAVVAYGLGAVVIGVLAAISEPWVRSWAGGVLEAALVDVAAALVLGAVLQAAVRPWVHAPRRPR